MLRPNVFTLLQTFFSKVGQSNVHTWINWRVRSFSHLFWGQRKSTAGHGGYCTPLERCYHKWGRPHLWPSLVSRTSLRKGKGRLYLFSHESNYFGVHQFAQPSHWTLMNDESRLANTEQSPQWENRTSENDWKRFFPPFLVWFDLANLSITRWATIEWTMPLIRKQRAMARRLLGWQYSRLLLKRHRIITCWGFDSSSLTSQIGSTIPLRATLFTVYLNWKRFNLKFLVCGE